MSKIEDEMSEAVALYRYIYKEESQVERLPGAGSDRRYYRLRGAEGGSVIATAGDDPAENRAFIQLARCFLLHGCAVPRVYAHNDDYTVYLQEDMGDQQLLPLLRTESGMPLARKALLALADLQTTPEQEWGELTAFSPFAPRLVKWDLNYFKYEFLKPCGIAFDEDKLEDDFEEMSMGLCNTDSRLQGFMYRDFQSRNVMVKAGELGLIDFQGGRKGPMVYDAVSFLWQAKAGFTDEERKELLEIYAEAISRLRGIRKEAILAEVDRFALFRTLQVLGAYGFRGLVEKKAHFIESIPGALANLRALMERGVLRRYPELEKVARKCVESRFATRPSAGELTLKVFSFSYKKGYPEDLTGNGGGFMFDCRGMHNPGRYERYKPLTGLDREVRDFLEEKGEVQQFIERAVDIVAPTVARYHKRGFSSLQVGFGCTGGRHRSVYCAQGFAKRMATKFPEVRVELIHREQGIKDVFNEQKKR